MTDSANLVPAPVATAVLDHVVRSIVDNPEAVKVEGFPDGDKILLEVRVGEGDLGRVIGRRGRTAMSIRAVVRAAAVRDGVEIDVDFVDDLSTATNWFAACWPHWPTLRCSWRNVCRLLLESSATHRAKIQIVGCWHVVRNCNSETARRALAVVVCRH